MSGEHGGEHGAWHGSVLGVGGRRSAAGEGVVQSQSCPIGPISPIRPIPSAILSAVWGFRLSLWWRVQVLRGHDRS